MAEPKQATLAEVLNYRPEQYLSDEDLSWVRSTFGNAKAIARLRKLLLPIISDPDLPVEEMGNDVYLSGVDWQSMPQAHAAHLIAARADAIKFIIGGIIKIKIIAASTGESPMEAALRRSKDSTK
jgi:hypothetical protein